MSEIYATVLRLLAQPTIWLLSLPQVPAMSIISLLACSAIIVGGLALAKLRFSPLWVLSILAPYIPIILLWILAYKKWPQKKA